MSEETITPVPPPGPLKGRLIYAGDLTVNGEEISGVALEVSRAELIGKALPMYRECVVTEAKSESPNPPAPGSIDYVIRRLKSEGDQEAVDLIEWLVASRNGFARRIAEMQPAAHSARYIMEDLNTEGLYKLSEITGLPMGVIVEAHKNIMHENKT